MEHAYLQHLYTDKYSPKLSDEQVSAIMDQIKIDQALRASDIEVTASSLPFPYGGSKKDEETFKQMHHQNLKEREHLESIVSKVKHMIDTQGLFGPEFDALNAKLLSKTQLSLSEDAELVRFKRHKDKIEAELLREALTQDERNLDKNIKHIITKYYRHDWDSAQTVT